MNKQRTWAKWALIVFFAVMALLTFFSGTIRNLTLPQITTKPVTSGTITPVVSGAGMTEAGDQAEVFTLRCSVSLEDSAMLKLGAEARITNQNGGGSKAVLTAIEPDKADPTNRKELIFTVTGDNAAPDQYLSLAVALETSKHDTVVPNAAVYKDSVGSFVYVVETTSSPLGSRSKVRRVDVEELRRDDGYTAVKGELTSQDYVVILSSAPLSDGQAVRFGD